jgi:hypothetical protein
MIPGEREALHHLVETFGMILAAVTTTDDLRRPPEADIKRQQATGLSTGLPFGVLVGCWVNLCTIRCRLHGHSAEIHVLQGNSTTSLVLDRSPAVTEVEAASRRWRLVG